MNRRRTSEEVTETFSFFLAARQHLQAQHTEEGDRANHCRHLNEITVRANGSTQAAHFRLFSICYRSFGEPTRLL